VLLDVGGFWAPLVAQLDRMADVGLLKPAGRELIKRSQSAEEALGVLEAARPAQPQEWITAEER
jgi:predicted Rossmann-fold nucleotide-binding protein